MINYQKDVVDLIDTSADLNTTEFVEKSREDEKRFNSLDSIKNYHALFNLKNEFIKQFFCLMIILENSKSKTSQKTQK